MSTEVSHDENGVPVYDEESACSFIAKETGLAPNIVRQVLDSEFNYMQQMGMFIDVPAEEEE